MKNKGYVLTMDAIIALIFVMGVFIAMLSVNFFNPDETSRTAFMNLHYVSEDSLDVLNKRGILDSVGYNWSLNTSESNEGAKNLSGRYLELIVPKNVGYQLKIAYVDDSGNRVEDIISENLTRVGNISEATVVTHSSRFLVGYGVNKPVVGSVARAYTVGVNLSGASLGSVGCDNLRTILLPALGQPDFCDDPAGCCVGDNCSVSPSGGTQKDCATVCYGVNCSTNIPNNVNGQATFDGLCCAYGEGGSCTSNIGNNLKGENNNEHGVSVTCCGPGCTVATTSAGNNIQNNVDVVCCGEGCNTNLTFGNHIQDGKNNVGCIGENCTTYIEIIGNFKMDNTDIFCSGDNCKVTAIGGNSHAGTRVFCCGTGCSASCDWGCSITPCPPLYGFCDICDNYCAGANVFSFNVPYVQPFAKSRGSKYVNITIFMDTNNNGSQDKNCTLIDWGENDTENFDPDADALDNALVRLLDILNFYDDKNNGTAEPLMNGTLPVWVPPGDGGEYNPIDVELNCDALKIDAVSVENIRSLWGPVQFKLLVWM